LRCFFESLLREQQSLWRAADGKAHYSPVRRDRKRRRESLANEHLAHLRIPRSQDFRPWDRPWGAFIVRYGPTGNEESLLDRSPLPLDDDLVDPPDYVVDDIPKDGESLGETWRAKRDGEIYVYLTKPVLGIPGIETWLSNFIPMSGKDRIITEQR
jgi:hypothetical protein